MEKQSWWSRVKSYFLCKHLYRYVGVIEVETSWGSTVKYKKKCDHCGRYKLESS